MELGLKILNAADKLFNRFGVRSVSMDDVSKELNISKKTLYKCFRDKNELIAITIKSHMDKMDDAILNITSVENHPIKQLFQITQFAISQTNSMNPNMMFDLKKYHHEIYADLIKHREEHIIVRILNNIRLGREKGMYRLDFDENVIAHSFSILTYTVFDQDEFKLTNFDPNLALSEVMKYHIRGIASSEGLKELESLNWN